MPTADGFYQLLDIWLSATLIEGSLLSIRPLEFWKSDKRLRGYNHLKISWRSKWCSQNSPFHVKFWKKSLGEAPQTPSRRGEPPLPPDQSTTKPCLNILCLMCIPLSPDLWIHLSSVTLLLSQIANAIINGQNRHHFFNNCPISIRKWKSLVESWKHQLESRAPLLGMLQYIYLRFPLMNGDGPLNLGECM